MPCGNAIADRLSIIRAGCGRRLLALMRACIALCWLLLAVPAPAALQGLPQIRHYSADQLPAPPTYADLAVDAQGLLYVGSSEGVMVLRSGVWELFELPRRSAIYSLLAADDGGVYVSGAGAFGRLQQQADGSLHYQDYLPQLAAAAAGVSSAHFYGLAQTRQGVHVRTGNTLYRLAPDGTLSHWQLPANAAQQYFVAGDALYLRLDGQGLVRLVEGLPQPLPGGQLFAQQGVVGVWARPDGLLIAGSEGLFASDGRAIRRLPGTADAVFARHRPYTGIQLPDGGLVFAAFDGTVLHFATGLEQVESFLPGAIGLDIYGFELDREDGLWLAGQSGVSRLRLPSPWTVFDQRHGLASRLYDSTWYEGQLWVAGNGLWRSQPATAGSLPQFVQVPWQGSELEVFALHGTPAGLLLGDRSGLAVLDAGQTQPRRLSGDHPRQSVAVLLPSAFAAERVLALGSQQAMWLGVSEGRWQVLARWEVGLSGLAGVQQTGPGEFWLGDAAGGVQRWRLDPVSGQLLQRHRHGQAQGLPVQAGQATRVVGLEGTLYAINGTAVHRFDGRRFVAAVLPALPGLERPWELASADTTLGAFAWTSRQLWWRPAGESAYRMLGAVGSKVPGYAGLKRHADGRLRLLARDRVLQFEPGLVSGHPPPLQARLDRLQLISRDGRLQPLPLSTTTVQVLPPGAGMLVRFGLDTVEPEIEFRYRLAGHEPGWSPWSAEREVSYRRLPPGDYNLELQARIRGGQTARPARYHLQVEPFWYERRSVQALSVLAAVMLIVLVVGVRQRAMYTRTRELEQRIAERTAELQVANQRLTALAVTDALTGIANRHALERALQRGWQRCLHSGEPLALVMADVDHFKQFNDTHGHPAGDAQLQRVAACFAAEVEAVDELAARYGGEEFVLVLPGLSLPAAMQRAERLRTRVEQALQAAGLPGSISLGVATLVPDAGTEPAQLLRLADQALYRAKRAGRNQVMAALDVARTGAGD